MSVKITGMAKLEKDLENRYGEMRMRAITDDALRAGGKVFMKEMEAQFKPWKVDGYSIEEMMLTEPQTINGVRTITVKWKGPHNRYAIIHLNELGTVHAPNPPGKGAIARALEASRKPYRRELKRVLEG